MAHCCTFTRKAKTEVITIPTDLPVTNGAYVDPQELFLDSKNGRNMEQQQRRVYCISCPLFYSFEGQQGAANGQDYWGILEGCTGL